MTSPSLNPSEEKKEKSFFEARLILYPYSFLLPVVLLPVSYLMAQSLWEAVSLLEVLLTSLLILLQIILHEVAHGIVVKLTGGTFHALVVKPWMVAVRVTHARRSWQEAQKVLVALAGPAADVSTALGGFFLMKAGVREAGAVLMMWGLLSAFVNLFFPHPASDGYRAGQHAYRAVAKAFRKHEKSAPEEEAKTAS